jgi:hypothetical protein
LYSGEVTPSTHGRQPGTQTALAVGKEKQTRSVLAEMGIPPGGAATATLATQAVMLNFLPTSEAVAVKEVDLFALIGDPPSRGTKCKALMALLKTGKIQRIGTGLVGDSFRYFKGVK